MASRTTHYEFNTSGEDGVVPTFSGNIREMDYDPTYASTTSINIEVPMNKSPGYFETPKRPAVNLPMQKAIVAPLQIQRTDRNSLYSLVSPKIPASSNENWSDQEAAVVPESNVHLHGHAVMTITTLPNECFLQILTFLPLSSLYIFALLCKRFHTIIFGPRFAKTLFAPHVSVADSFSILSRVDPRTGYPHLQNLHDSLGGDWIAVVRAVRDDVNGCCQRCRRIREHIARALIFISPIGAGRFCKLCAQQMEEAVLTKGLTTGTAECRREHRIVKNHRQKDPAASKVEIENCPFVPDLESSVIDMDITPQRETDFSHVMSALELKKQIDHCRVPASDLRKSSTVRTSRRLWIPYYLFLPTESIFTSKPTCIVDPSFCGPPTKRKDAPKVPDPACPIIVRCLADALALSRAGEHILVYRGSHQVNARRNSSCGCRSCARWLSALPRSPILFANPGSKYSLMDVDWCHEDIKTREYDKIYEHGEQNDDSSSSNGEASENMDNNSTEEIEIEEEYLANYASVKVTGESEEDFVARVTRWLKAPVENIGKSLRTGRNHTSQIRGMPASTPLASRSLGFDRDQMLSTSSANLCSGDIVVPPRPLISSTHRTPFVCFTFCVLENIDILSSYNVFDSSLEAGGSLLDGHHTPFPAVEVCRPTILRNVRITNASSLCGISAYRLQGPNGGRRCVGGMHHVEALGEKTLLIMQNCVVQSISSSPRTHWEYRGGSEGEINGDDDVEIGCGCSSGLCLNSNFPSSPSAFSASPSTFGEPVFVAIDEADSPGTIPDSFPNPGPAIMMDPDVEFVEGEISGNRIRAYSKGLSALGNQVIWLSPTPTSSVDGEEDDGSEEARRQVEEIVRKMIKCGNSVSTF